MPKVHQPLKGLYNSRVGLVQFSENRTTFCNSRVGFFKASESRTTLPIGRLVADHLPIKSG